MSITTDDQATIRDLEEDDDIMVIAAQTSGLLRDSPARLGAPCLVTARSVDALSGQPHVGTWQEVASKAPQTAKTWMAASVLAGVVVAGSFGLAPSNWPPSPAPPSWWSRRC